MRRRLGTAYGIGREVLVRSAERLPHCAIPWRDNPGAARLCDRPAYDALTCIEHRLFVDAYALHGNAARAARAAGYGEQSAAHAGARLRRRPDVQAAVKERLAEASTRADRAMARLEEIALMHLGEIETADPQKVNTSRKACADILRIESRMPSLHQLITSIDLRQIRYVLSDEQLKVIARGWDGADASGPGAGEPGRVRERD
jgi:Terminase small subunit